MTLQPLNRTAASVLRATLEQKGWNPVEAEAAARGLQPVGCVLEGLSDDEIHTVLIEARKNHVEALSGPDWVVLASSASRLSSMARPGTRVFSESVSERLALYANGFMDVPLEWQTCRGAVSLEAPLLVGILNVTPDSFSDGGQFSDVDRAIDHVAIMVEEGAGMIDVGAESTRPGVKNRLPVHEEWSRMEGVLDTLVKRFPDVPLSVDTVNSETARRAIDNGAWAINDVSGLRVDPKLGEVCAESGAGLILMHSRGTVTDMATYDHARYDDVTREVTTELRASVDVANESGVARTAIVVDPGLGFAKRPEHNLRLLRDLDAFRAFGAPVMVGPSRKRFLGDVTGNDVDSRDADTATICALAFSRGARLFRVHSIKETKDAFALLAAVDD